VDTAKSFIERQGYSWRGSELPMIDSLVTVACAVGAMMSALVVMSRLIPDDYDRAKVLARRPAAKPARE
jgi:hypothetical protein